MGYDDTMVGKGLHTLTTGAINNYKENILSNILNNVPESNQILNQWENIGLEIAQESSRSWETSLAYFSVSVKVQQYLPSGQFLGWCNAGIKLAKDSTKVSEYFLNASPQTMVRLRPRYIDDWVSRVTKLYKGTWKSTNLTCKLFEYTPAILETLSSAISTAFILASRARSQVF